MFSYALSCHLHSSAKFANISNMQGFLNTENDK